MKSTVQAVFDLRDTQIVEANMYLLTILGMVLSALIFIGRPKFLCNVLSFFLLFILYLSNTVTGERFYSFQWDVLLLETGFLALFFAPLTPGA